MSSRALRLPMLLSLLVAVVAACGEKPATPSRPPVVPEKTVVLTFDDASRTHLEFVAPLLEERGFGATFFVTAYWMADRDDSMSFEEIAELHRRGFEIGNHTFGHAGMHNPAAADHVGYEIDTLEQRLAEVGVPKPVSFAWPGGSFGPESLVAIRDRGYAFGRRGKRPDVPPQEQLIGPTYDPRAHDPMLVPTTGIARPDWTMERFRQIVSRAVRGQAVVLQFHGIPDRHYEPSSTTPEAFRAFMDHLKQEGFRCLALRDLRPFVDWKNPPADRLAQCRSF